MKRKLFCEINPRTYAISVKKMRIIRHMKNCFTKDKFAKTKSEKLPLLVYKHKSLIRRKLGDVDMQLQENKANNLSIATPKINGVLINPNEIFSFWYLVGDCTKRKGYKEGLIISPGSPSKRVGGGMCQFTNLIHWLVLHSSLEILEHHHHDGIDIFPDYGRKVPFGCGTSIMYNYLDYRFKNNTDSTFQLITYTTETHLCGELRVSDPQPLNYHICEEDAHFVEIDGTYFRRNAIARSVIDKHTGNEVDRKIIKRSNARVLYDAEFINKELLRSVMIDEDKGQN